MTAYSWAPPILWPMPTSGWGISSRLRLIRWVRSREWSAQEAGRSQLWSVFFVKRALTVVAENLLIQHAGLALIPHVGDPYRPNAYPGFGEPLVQFIPERLV